MSSNLRKVDKNWIDLFNYYPILKTINKNGVYHISSNEINNFKNYRGGSTDARLMTKFDYKKSLPQIFKDENLSILPISRGEYVIGHFEAYSNIEASPKSFLKDRTELLFPEWIETISHRDITSESTMLNVAVISGMLEELFNTTIIAGTVSGRMGSSRFTYTIGTTNQKEMTINVNNSQIEIDGGFETEDSLILIEAKNNITDTFLIRQLYYPYRRWQEQLKHKKVIPVYLQYYNGIFNFSIFEFKDMNSYSSLNLITRKNFIIDDKQHISIQNIIDIFKSSTIIPEPKLMLPQANSLVRVLEVVRLAYERDKITTEEITLANNFDKRQGDYYKNAAEYLGLIKRIGFGQGSKITDDGKKLMNMSTTRRNLELAKIVFQYKFFNKAFKYFLETRKKLEGPSLYYNVFKDDPDYMPDSLKSGENTRKRRASTIASWINEIVDFVDDY